uniref:Uncharacterized protein n=1 Tax=Candidatus Kentrum sp. FM TaxID=2126340 RepID=A0A450TR74_9GAMM|nr:MAG: hypothetical protein BECKFM1743A_GA0114220_1000917 [Candidatus Kentron sp. FM]VFJ70505.1 MAG: hypothetical protein BECKFM1743C_GA0114222_105631 [Candidatus Kentron sp. FM]VFK10440.1 MAG: hypothetical protein BECKFM1743B_GA0114221_101405 [Candidatus Kentron sp. FM]
MPFVVITLPSVGTVHLSPQQKDTPSVTFFDVPAFVRWAIGAGSYFYGLSEAVTKTLRIYDYYSTAPFHLPGRMATRHDRCHEREIKNAVI